MFLRALIINLILVLFPIVAVASGFQNPLASQDIINIVKSFVLAVIYVGAPGLVVAIVWVGFLFISAQGNPEGLNDAKNIAVKVLLGGIILLSLWAIVSLVGNTLAGLSTVALLIILISFYAYIYLRKK